KLLMGGNVSYTQLASLLSRGAEIKHTKLSENFTYQDYLEHHKTNLVIPLFNVEDKGKIQFCDDPDQ
ncbi:sodium:proton antiporter, partial [Vibrio parahaemolyticus]